MPRHSAAAETNKPMTKETRNYFLKRINELNTKKRNDDEQWELEHITGFMEWDKNNSKKQ